MATDNETDTRALDAAIGICGALLAAVLVVAALHGIAEHNPMRVVAFSVLAALWGTIAWSTFHHLARRRHS